jgi:hypothetical protein
MILVLIQSTKPASRASDRNEPSFCNNTSRLETVE